MSELSGADPPACADLPVLPKSRLGRACRLRQGHALGVHRQPPLRISRPATAVRHRAGRHRRGPAGPADHQHRRLRPRRSRTRSAGRSPVPTPCRRVAAGVHPFCRRDTAGPTRRRDRTDRTSASTSGRCSRRTKFEDHSAITGIGASRLGRRLDGSAAVADDRGVRGGRRRRRLDAGRHRRPVHLSRPRHRRHGRGRRERARGRARAAADVDQRRHGHVRSRRLGDRGDDGRLHRHGPARAVLPHAVGGDLRPADEGGQDGAARRCPHHQLADAVRRDVGRTHVGAQRTTALRPLRHHPGDARLDRAQPARQRRAQPDGDLPRSDDDGRLPRRRG